MQNLDTHTTRLPDLYELLNYNGDKDMNHLSIHNVVKIEVRRTCEHWKRIKFSTNGDGNDFEVTVFSDKWLPITRIPDKKEEN